MDNLIAAALTSIICTAAVAGIGLAWGALLNALDGRAARRWPQGPIMDHKTGKPVVFKRREPL